MSALARALEKIYRLNVGVTGSGATRHERPHKPVLLLAVLDAIDAGEAAPERVPWCRPLVARFGQRFEVVRKADDDCTPRFPFFHLRSDGIWEAFRTESGISRSLEDKPNAADADTGSVWARFTQEWLGLIRDASTRAVLRDALIARYFPLQRADLQAGWPSEASIQNKEELGVKRSASFRRLVVDNYDHQCCACGLRICLPEPEVTFVDAAHLVPFAESRNDHPTNGVALCKHHHWAMDQRILAPGPDGLWHVSKRIIPRRSRGEEELFSLNGQPLLAPTEPAYAPSVDALRWRYKQLIN